MENLPQNSNQSRSETDRGSSIPLESGPEQYPNQLSDIASRKVGGAFKKKLLVGIIILAALIGGYFVLAQNQSWWPFEVSDKQQETSEQEDTSNWQTYRNEEYGFEFKYPTSHNFIEHPLRVGIDYFNVEFGEGEFQDAGPVDYRVIVKDSSLEYEIAIIELNFRNVQKTELNFDRNNFVFLNYDDLARPSVTEYIRLGEAVIRNGNRIFVIEYTHPALVVEFQTILSTFKFTR